MKHDAYWTVADCVEQWGCSERAIRRWVQRGELIALKFGRKLRFRESDIRKFEDSRVIRPK